MTPSRALLGLFEAYPLPVEWEVVAEYVDRVCVEGLPIGLCGLVARHAELGEVAGSAGGMGEPPIARAYFELLERVAVIQATCSRGDVVCWTRSGDARSVVERGQLFPCAPEDATFTFSRSNGVAIGVDSLAAARSAENELLERDLVLRSWFGQLAPRQVPLELGPAVRLRTCYDLSAYELRAAEESHHVASVVIGFPRRDGLPLLLGTAAHVCEKQAQDSALREALQRLGFLWGEAIPACEPAFSKTPDYHQEYYLNPANHRLLREWLAGDMLRKSCIPAAGQARFVDLTPSSLRGKLVVVKAVAENAVVLTFGSGRPSIFGTAPIHPIA